MKGLFAHASIAPGEIVAGQSDEFLIHLEIGPDYPNRPTRIVFDFEVMLGASPVTRRKIREDGYVDAYVSNPDVTYTLRNWAPELGAYETGDTPRMRQGLRMVQMDLAGGLKRGDTIDLRWGDVSSGGGSGTKATTVVPRENFHAWVKVRYFAEPDRGMPDLGRSREGCPRPVPDLEVELRYRVRAREPRFLRLLRKPGCAVLIPMDVYWNVAEVKAAGDLVVSRDAARKNGHGVFVYRRPDVRMRSKGLPLRATARMDNVFGGMNLYWGDLHVHSVYSFDAGAQANTDSTPDDLYAYGRHRAALDFMAVTDHHMPGRDPVGATITRGDWESTLAAVARHNRPGEFVVFPGYEFTDWQRGDTCVLFNGTPSYDQIQRRDFQDIRSIWRYYRKEGVDLMTIPHFQNCGGKAPEWLVPDDPGLEPALEIFSCHNSYEDVAVQEKARALRDACVEQRCGLFFLRNGYRYAFVANSDGHDGHVGLNGVTAVFAPELTREAILGAYRNRCVYGTTGARIRLIVSGNGYLMGSVAPNERKKVIHIEAVGELPLKKIDVLRNGEPHARLYPDGRSYCDDLTVADDEPSSWYVRVTQVDNHIAFATPIWYA